MPEMARLSWMAKKFTRGVTYQWKAKDLANAREYLYEVANIVIQRCNERLLKCLGTRGIGVPEQKRDIVKTRKITRLRVFFGQSRLAPYHTGITEIPVCTRGSHGICIWGFARSPYAYVIGHGNGIRYR